MIVLEQTWPVTDSLVGFSIQIVSEIGGCDSEVIFTTTNSNLTFFRLIERRSLTLNQVLVFENTHCINGTFSSEESDCNLTI